MFHQFCHYVRITMLDCSPNDHVFTTPLSVPIIPLLKLTDCDRSPPPFHSGGAELRAVQLEGESRVHGPDEHDGHQAHNGGLPQPTDLQEDHIHRYVTSIVYSPRVYEVPSPLDAIQLIQSPMRNAVSLLGGAHP